MGSTIRHAILEPLQCRLSVAVGFPLTKGQLSTKVTISPKVVKLFWCPFVRTGELPRFELCFSFILALVEEIIHRSHRFEASWHHATLSARTVRQVQLHPAGHSHVFHTISPLSTSHSSLLYGRIQNFLNSSVMGAKAGSPAKHLSSHGCHFQSTHPWCSKGSRRSYP
jgi:hypothetical protein